MKKWKTYILFMVLLLSSFTLVSCGKSKESSGNNGNPSNTIPLANAGTDQNVSTESVVILDGSDSSDADNNTLTYIWSFVFCPSDSTATISDPTAVNPSFTVDIDGAYVLALVVNDGKANSIPDYITVTASSNNSAPVAIAGTDQNVVTESIVFLDGSASSDADDDTLTYSWSFVFYPSGSTSTISDPTAINPTFTADIDGAYILALTVNDGKTSSLPDYITITASSSNSTPVANAGGDQSVVVGSTVFLDGSASSDADGNTLTYNWSFVSTPAGSTATISDPNAEYPTFTADVIGSYVISLKVYDGYVFSASDSVMIQGTPDLIDLGVALKDIVYRPQTDFAYGLDAVNKKLIYIDLASKSIQGEASLLYEPAAACVDDANDRMFIINWGNTFITEFDLSSKTATNYIYWPAPTLESGVHFHIYCHPDRLFIIDPSWSPSLWTIELSDTSIYQNHSAIVTGIGDLVFNADMTRFYSWYQYGWSAGYAGSNVYRYEVNGTIFSQTDASSLGYPTMKRDPLNTPIFLDETLNFVIAKRFVLNSENLLQVYYTFPSGEEIYAYDSNNSLAASKHNIYDLNTFNVVSTIPIDNISKMFYDKHGVLYMLVNSQTSLYYQ